MDKRIDFRLLKADDLNSYRQIRLDCLRLYPDNFGTTYDEEVNAASLKFDKALLQTDTHAFLFGAFQDENLIGICGFVQENRTKTNHRGEINQMFVKPAFAGQGIGSKLLQLTIDKAFTNTCIEQIILGAVHTNKTAVKLYGRLGFVQYGMLENYFKQNDRYWTQISMILTKENYLESRSG